MQRRLWDLAVRFLLWRPMSWSMRKWRPLFGFWVLATIKAEWFTTGDLWEAITQVNAGLPIRMIRHPETWR